MEIRFQEVLKKFNEWLPQFELVCNDMGAIGSAAMIEFKNSHCIFELTYADFCVASHNGISGQYHSRDYDCNFRNKITFGELAFIDRTEFFCRAFHEAIHAIQYTRCASLYACSMNKHVSIVLCPRHRIMQTLMMERDAYVKESLFVYLLGLFESGKHTEIEALWNSGQHLLEQLVGKGKTILTDEMDGHNLYVNNRLDCEEKQAFHTSYPWRENTVFVQLDKEDLWLLGDSLDKNTLYADRESICFEEIDLTEKQEEKIRMLNEHLKIKNDRDLPSLGEALKDAGLTKDAYIALCRN